MPWQALLPGAPPVPSPKTPVAATSSHGDDPHTRATLIVAETIGELMGFWNFKPSMGRVWTVLYLSRRPLSSEELVARTGLSAGSVSMTLADLQRWGVVQKAMVPASRKRYFEAETDVMSTVARVFRERELRLVGNAVRQLEEAARILDEEGGSSVPDRMLENRFLATRVRSLLGLARAGRTMVEQLSRAGAMDLSAIRGTLSRRR